MPHTVSCLHHLLDHQRNPITTVNSTTLNSMHYSDAERTRCKLAFAGQVFKLLSEQEWNNHIVVRTFTVTQYHNVCLLSVTIHTQRFLVITKSKSRQIMTRVYVPPSTTNWTKDQTSDCVEELGWCLILAFCYLHSVKVAY